MAEPWLLATPRRVLRAGTGTPIPVRAGPGLYARLAHAAARVLAEAPDGHVVTGAIPYDEDVPAILALTTVTTSPRLCEPTRPVVPGAVAVPPDDPAYLAAVTGLVRRLRAGAAEKAVLARTLDISGPGIDDAGSIVARLIGRYPSAYVFGVDLSAAGSRRVLLGASPELLLARRGERVVLNPLAGSAPRHQDPARDRAHAHGLLRSAKDRREHQLVTEELAERLRPLSVTLDLPARPSLTAAGPLWHLSTRIRARLRRPAPTSLELAALLHPTAAVCGVPRTAARELIAEFEKEPREYYTGLVGWTDRHGDGQWVVALRCGTLGEQGLRLHAGAGVLPASRPDAEHAETARKLSALLGVLSPAHP
ncbi:isochorismate synthase MenF [Streptomyces sp. NPDC018029]|uniref:isochorismate synthase MenF n=1 Tax=Streptomyces sp. NPDC018029 TaxID=3365032 RepID=UPI00378EFDBD